MKDLYTLYAHITPNNKRYFGITCRAVELRWGRDGYGYRGQLFWRAIQKYGWDNIQHIVLAENLSKEWACKLEQDLIWKYQTTNRKYGYNIYEGGDTGNRGYTMSDEQKEKLRQANLGKQHVEETKKKISCALKGRTHTLDHNKKVRKANTGKKRTLAQRKKLSDAHKGYITPYKQRKRQSESLKNYIRNLSSEERQKRVNRIAGNNNIPITLYKNNALIKEFHSCKDCAEYLGVSTATVCRVINGKMIYKEYKIYKK